MINTPCRTAFAPLTTWQAESGRRLALTWPDLREESVLLAGSRADAANLRSHPGLMMTRMMMMMHAMPPRGSPFERRRRLTSDGCVERKNGSPVLMASGKSPSWCQEQHRGRGKLPSDILSSGQTHVTSDPQTRTWMLSLDSSQQDIRQVSMRAGPRSCSPVDKMEKEFDPRDGFPG